MNRSRWRLDQLVPIQRLVRDHVRVFRELSSRGPFVITKRNRPVAVLLSVEEYERLVGER